MAIKQRLDLDIQSYKRNLAQAQRQLTDFDRKSRPVGKNVGDAVSRGAESAERSWTRSGRRIASTLETIKRLAIAAFAVDKLIGFASHLVRVTDQMNSFRVSFEELTGSASKAQSLMKDISDLSKSSPLTTKDAMGAARQLMAYGLAAEDVVGQLRILGDMAAALSPDNMTGMIESAARALGQLSGRAIVSMEEINQLRDAGVDAMGLLSKATGKTRQELEGLLAEGAASKDVIRALLSAMEAEYAGAGAKMASSITVQIAKLKDRVDQILAGAGNTLLPSLAGDIRKLTAALEGMERSGQIGQTLKEVGKTLDAIYQGAKKVIGVLWDWRGVLTDIAMSFMIFKAISGPIATAQNFIKNFRAELGKLQISARNAKGEITALYIEPKATTAGLDAAAQSLGGVAQQAKEASTSMDDLLKGFNSFKGSDVIGMFHPDGKPPVVGTWTQYLDEVGRAKNLTQEQADALNRVYYEATNAGRSMAEATQAMNAHLIETGAVKVSGMGKAMHGLSRAASGVATSFRAVFSVANLATGVFTAILSVIISSVIQWALFSDRVRGATEALKKYRKEYDNLKDMVENGDDLIKGRSRFEASVKIGELKFDEADLARLPETIRKRVQEAVSKGTGTTVSVLDDLYSAAVSLGSIPGGGGASEAAEIRARGRLRGMGIDPKDIERSAETLRALRDQAHLLKDHQKLYNDIGRQMGGNLAIQLGSYQAEEEALAKIETKTEAQVRRWAFVKSEIERINRLMHPQPSEGAGDYGSIEIERVGETTDNSAAERAASEARRRKARIEDLKLELALYERTRGLEDEALEAQERVNALVKERHTLVQEQNDALLNEATGVQHTWEAVARLRSSGKTDAEIRAATGLTQEQLGLAAAIQQTIDARDEEIRKAKERSTLIRQADKDIRQLFGTEADQVKALMQQFGSVEDLFKKGLLDDVVRWLPDLSQVDQWTRELAGKLADVERRENLHLISPEAAQREAEEVATVYQTKLKEMLSRIDFSVLPDELREQVEQFFDGLASTVGQNVRTPAEKQAEAYQKLADTLEEAAERMNALVSAGRGMLQVAKTLGAASDAAEGLLSGLLDVADAMNGVKQAQAQIARQNAQRAAEGKAPLSKGTEAMMMLPGQVGMVAGLATGLMSLSTSLQARQKQEAEEAKAALEEQRRLREQMADYTKQIRVSMQRLFRGGRVGSGLTDPEIAAGEDALSKLSEFMLGLSDSTRTGRGRGSSTPTDSAQSIESGRMLVEKLDATGLFDFNLAERFDQLLEGDMSLRSVLSEILYGSGSSRDDWSGVASVLRKLREEFGKATDDIPGAIQQVTFLSKYLGEDVFAQFKSFLDMLTKTGTALNQALDEDLKKLLTEAATLNLKDQAGRDRLKAIIGEIAKNFPQMLGNLSADDLESILSELQRMLDDAGQKAGTAGEEDSWTKNVSYLRQLTQAEGSEMVLLLREISFYVQKIARHSGAYTPGQMPTGFGGAGPSWVIPTPPIVPTPMVPRPLPTSAPTVNIGDVMVRNDADIDQIMVAIEKKIRTEAKRAF